MNQLYNKNRISSLINQGQVWVLRQLQRLLFKCIQVSVFEQRGSFYDINTLSGGTRRLKEMVSLLPHQVPPPLTLKHLLLHSPHKLHRFFRFKNHFQLCRTQRYGTVEVNTMVFYVPTEEDFSLEDQYACTAIFFRLDVVVSRTQMFKVLLNQDDLAGYFSMPHFSTISLSNCIDRIIKRLLIGRFRMGTVPYFNQQESNPQRRF